MKYTKEWLESEIKQGKSFNFIGFWKEDKAYGEFSNFYPSKFKSIEPKIMLTYKNGDKKEVEFTCSEQYFMYRKATTFKDSVIASKILTSKVAPYKYKDLGKEVRGYVDSVWDEVRYNHMLDGIRLKFTQDPKLKEFLLSTGDSILVEASPFDKIWGIKKGVVDKKNRPTDWKNVSNWGGLNLLGFALMELRDELRK